jgi:hypothetical protein
MIWFILALLGVFLMFWLIDNGRLPRWFRWPKRKVNHSQDNESLIILLLAVLIGMEMGDD